MPAHTVVSHEQWVQARKDHLRKEKEFTRLRDELSAQRRGLPWEKVEKQYTFHSTDGDVTLADLFDNRGQLIIYHFMYGPDWDAGCKSCSFWIDNFNGIIVHLRHRDTNLAIVSRAPIETLEAYRKRMGWNVNWVSALDSDFNYDFHVTMTPSEVAGGGGYYNYREHGFSMEEAPGISVFRNTDDGIFHTYSTYERGLDMLNGAYHLLDITPKGRDEQETGSMGWLRRHDEYEDAATPSCECC